MTLEPYSAVLFASYGGPNKPDDVLPFMRNATAGKNIPDERLLEVSEHYMLFGGKSPINELNAALMEAVRAELARRGIEVPVVIGNRNWTPYIGDTVDELIGDGHTRVLALATSAYRSYSSCRQYCEDLLGARDGKDIEIDKIDPFAETPEFVSANARAVVDGVRTMWGRIGDGELRVLFVTHSIPLTMNQASATGEPESRYDAQHLRVAEAVAREASETLGETLTWELTYCSRSGAPHIPWLEPDINDRLEEVAEEGVAGVVAVPFGFIKDHMEVAYDLDTEAKQTAERLSLPYERAATVGTDEGFVAMLVDKLLHRAAVARGEAEDTTICQFSTGRCCLPRPATT
ncbi:ferrochelatase [Tessaracoccus sp. MC1865]|uniref:ferrochelatase n=1 Tax=unclassified Tessaracoccus TaxID=2635419 RepID=UPI001601E6CE|nr:ferrochelatase [Tessaracoccus sp. MC1865]MBB1484824.1 ferrochelatase [Tessaracoccus sp. MC1865]MBB1510148.1 ferrochelatase [Tessaracoccus sp. MC1756]QTO38774.1 ferrochelatase [Tessaracoccus sp. MC1865]